MALFSVVSGVRTTESRFMERAMGIEPMSEAWEARNKNLKTLELGQLAVCKRLLIGK
jgi:hypothetical protein